MKTKIEIAESLFAEVFAPERYRDNRSQAYKDGVRAGIRSHLKIEKAKVPFVLGSAEADAWFAGVEEGRRKGTQFMETMTKTSYLQESAV